MSSKSNRTRREKINLMLSPEERKIITDKAIKYGYGDRLAEYVRDACIYERIYIEELDGKTLICKIVSEYISEIKILLKQQSELRKNITISKEDIDMLVEHNKFIRDSIDNLTQTLTKVLSSNSIQKVQKRLRLIEKYKTTPEKIDAIVSSKFSIANPNTLSFKNPRSGYIVFHPNSEEHIELKYINYNAISVMIDCKREIALQNKQQLFFKIEDNILKVYIAKYFKLEDELFEYMQKQKSKQEKFVIYDCAIKSKVGEG